ncbi:MAG: hypothetical protein HUU55_23705 [Myxococcales bacterium]|nr:hypothetical protein [Myxococcales bacterium]
MSTNGQIEVPLIFARTLYSRTAPRVDKTTGSVLGPQDHWHDDTRSIVVTNHFDDAYPEPATYPVRLQIAQPPARWKVPQGCDTQAKCHLPLVTTTYGCNEPHTTPYEVRCKLQRKGKPEQIAFLPADVGFQNAFAVIKNTPYVDAPGCEIKKTTGGLTTVTRLEAEDFHFEHEGNEKGCTGWKSELEKSQPNAGAGALAQYAAAQKYLENLCWAAIEAQGNSGDFATKKEWTEAHAIEPPPLSKVLDGRFISATAAVRVPLSAPVRITRFVLHYRLYHWDCLYHKCEVPEGGPRTVLHEGKENWGAAFAWRLGTKAITQGLDARLITLDEWGEEQELTVLRRGRMSFDPGGNSGWHLSVYDEATGKPLPDILPRPEHQLKGLLAARLSSPLIPADSQWVDPANQRLLLHIRIRDTTASPYFDRIQHRGTNPNQTKLDSEDPPMVGRLVCPVHVTLYTVPPT